MMPQVVTTGAVTGTGPSMKTTLATRGESVMAPPGCGAPRSAARSARRVRSAAAAWRRAEPRAATRRRAPPDARPGCRSRAAPPVVMNSRVFQRSSRKCSRPAATPAAKHKPSSSAVIACCIQRQADQQPSARPSSSSGAGPEDPGAEPTIDPATKEGSQQCRQHDGPTQDADLRHLTCEGGLAFAQPVPVPLPALPNRAQQSVRLVGHQASSGPAGRRAAMIWRIAAMCSRVAATRSVRSVSSSVRKRLSTTCSS